MGKNIKLTKAKLKSIFSYMVHVDHNGCIKFKNQFYKTAWSFNSQYVVTYEFVDGSASMTNNASFLSYSSDLKKNEIVKSLIDNEYDLIAFKDNHIVLSSSSHDCTYDKIVYISIAEVNELIEEIKNKCNAVANSIKSFERMWYQKRITKNTNVLVNDELKSFEPTQIEKTFLQSIKRLVKLKSTTIKLVFDQVIAQYGGSIESNTSYSIDNGWGSYTYGKSILTLKIDKKDQHFNYVMWYIIALIHNTNLLSNRCGGGDEIAKLRANGGAYYFMYYNTRDRYTSISG